MSTDRITISNILQAPADEPVAKLSPPRHLASISVLEDRQIRVDSNVSLSHFSPPPLGANLAEGFQQYRKLRGADKFSGHPNRLDRILRAILEAKTKDDLQTADIVTWRGVVTKLCLGDRKLYNVQYYRGVLYIEEHDPTPNKIERLFPGSYEGHRFETLCTTGTGLNMDVNARWYSVVRRELGSLSILLAGEVDCVKVHEGNKQTLLELKSISAQTVDNNRLKKFFFQSHLLGVPEILVGYKENSILTRTETIQVDAMPQMIARKSPGTSTWNFDMALSSAHRVLSTIRAQCAASKQPDETVWKVELGGKGSWHNTSLDMRVLRLDEIRAMNRGEQRVGILPRWYVEALPPA